MIISDASGEELERYLVSCDENGNPVEWTSATGTSILYTYDDQGRTLRTETYNDDTLLTSTEYTWSGALRVSVTVKTLTQEQRTEYTYDDKGNITQNVILPLINLLIWEFQKISFKRNYALN